MMMAPIRTQTITITEFTNALPMFARWNASTKLSKLNQLLIIFACTILQKLFFKYVYRNADQDDEVMTREERKRLKQFHKEQRAAKKAAKGAM